MEQLSNAFSVLELDAGDDRLPAPAPASTSTTHQNSENSGTDISVSGKNKKKANGSSNSALANNGKELEEIAAVPEYKLPLVWIDLEMTGLTKRVLHSSTSEREAEKQVIEFVKKHVGTYTPLLAGNSIYMDFLFLKKYMPELASLFSHVVVDVSSVKALCMRWYPRDRKKVPSKENKHRAMDDIRESITELKYYKDNIFKSRLKK